MFFYNNKGSDDTWSGQLILDGEYYSVDDTEQISFGLHPKIFTDIGSGVLIVSKTESTSGHLGPVDGYNYLNPNRTPDVKSPTGKTYLHQSSRELGFTTYFTGGDDDHTDPHAVGGGTNIQDLCWEHKIGDANPEIIYADFGTINNDTHIHEGYIQWKDALNDFVTFEIAPKTTAYTSGTNTNYNLFGGYLVVPAAGDGVIAIADVDRVLVKMPVDLDTGKQNGAGYYDATWNTTTKQFESIAPNLSGTGQYNMFALEVTLNKFVNRQHCLGAGFINMKTSDKSQVGHNMRVKTSVHTRGADHDWWGNATMVMHRKKTV